MWTDVAATVAAGPGWVAGSSGVPALVGKALAPGPPPAAESRASWSTFHPVHVVGVLAQGGLWPATVCTTCGPALQCDPLGVRAARHELRLAAAQGVLGRPHDGDADRLAVNGEQVGHARPGQGGRRRVRLDAG